MGTDGAIRASQQDRENVAEVLRQAYAEGRLELPELRDRCGAAYAARTWADLWRLTADLPGPPPAPDLPGHGCLAGQDPPRPAPAASRPFTPMVIMAVIWLAIATLAHAPGVLAMPLIVLALWALYTAGRPAPAAGVAHPAAARPPQPGDGASPPPAPTRARCRARRRPHPPATALTRHGRCSRSRQEAASWRAPR